MSDQQTEVEKVIYKLVINYFIEAGEHNKTPEYLYRKIIKQIEKPLYAAALFLNRGNQTKTAISLGVSRGTLRTKIKDYGLHTKRIRSK